MSEEYITLGKEQFYYQFTAENMRGLTRFTLIDGVIKEESKTFVCTLDNAERLVLLTLLQERQPGRSEQVTVSIAEMSCRLLLRINSMPDELASLILTYNEAKTLAGFLSRITFGIDARSGESPSFGL